MTKRYLVSVLLMLAAGACKDTLVVGNDNSPDRTRVFTNAVDLESFTSGLFAVMHQGTLGGSNDGLQTQMYVLSLENNSGLANFAMGPRGALPRASINNQPGAQGDGSNTHDWFRGHRAARQAALAIASLKGLPLPTAARQARALAFARLVQGIALGNLSLAYDSASILSENDATDANAAVISPLSGYQAVNTAALGYLDSAIAIANANPTSTSNTTFPIPVLANLWINGLSISQPLFIQIARSYQAYFRANVARTPAERAAVNWAQVIADANAGITADLTPNFDPTNGWDITWIGQQYSSAAWHQMSPLWTGMADTSGAFNTWLATAPASRASFAIFTPDTRFPGTCTGNTALTRASLQACGPVSAGQSYTLKPYLRNRPTGNDIINASIQTSQYDFWRSRQMQQASRIGPYPIFVTPVLRLLQAEGNMRTGGAAGYTAAAALISTSRVAAGLPTLVGVGIVDTLTVIPGGNACVPRVPDAAAAFTATKCGNIWDAMKYEYRLESMYMMYGSWFLASRGWGDLPEGTSVQWPVPNQEMLARQQPYYGFGGVGQPGGAAKGNYGLFAGGVY